MDTLWVRCGLFGIQHKNKRSGVCATASSKVAEVSLYCRRGATRQSKRFWTRGTYLGASAAIWGYCSLFCCWIDSFLYCGGIYCPRFFYWFISLFLAILSHYFTLLYISLILYTFILFHASFLRFIDFIRWCFQLLSCSLLVLFYFQ